MNARNHKAYTIPGVDSMQATLATQRQPTPLLLAPVGDKTVELDFDGGRLSSDAGLILLKDNELPRSKLRGIKPPNPETVVVSTALARQFGGVDHGVSCVGTTCRP